MRREGRQHGTARTYCILPSSTPKPTKPSGLTQPTAGAFARVPSKPSKPTNHHSKFTAMHGHLHHSLKSKDKRKGAQKLRASDFDLGYDEIVVLRVTGKGHDETLPEYKLKLDRYSAQDLVDALESNRYDFDGYY